MPASTQLCGQRDGGLGPRGTRPPRALGLRGRSSSVWGTGRPWTRQAMRSQKRPLRCPEESWEGRGQEVALGRGPEQRKLPPVCAAAAVCPGPLSPFWNPGQASRPPQLVGASLRSPSWSPPTRARPQVLPLPGLGPPPRAFSTIDLGAGRVLSRTQGGHFIRGHSGRWGPRSEWRRDSPMGHSLATGRRLQA